MILVVSNGADETASYLCSRMKEAGMAHTRLATESTISTCSIRAAPQGTALCVEAGNWLLADDIKAIWYRRPMPLQPRGDGDRHEQAFVVAEWTAALEGYLTQVPSRRWINHPAAIMEAGNKLEQLRRAPRYGLSVPPWLCTLDRDEAIEFLREHDRQVIAKPLYCGYIERDTPEADTVVFTSRVHPKDLDGAEPSLGAPTLFQRDLRPGTDFRLTVVDDDIEAVRLTPQEEQEADIRRNNMVGVRYAIDRVPDHVADAVRGLVRSYGLRFAAIDMIFSNNDWYFLEVNANGQWAWLDMVGGASIYKLFLKAFGRAL